MNENDETKNVDGARSISKAATEIADGTIVVIDEKDADIEVEASEV